MNFYAASFSMKTCFYETSYIFISSTRRIFTKLLAVSESSIKMKVRSHWTLFVILLTSAVICKQKRLPGNEIAHYL